MTLVCLFLFVGCIYAVGFVGFEVVWVPGLIAMGLAVLTYLIPQQLLGRSDTIDHEAIHMENPNARHAGH